VPFRAIAGSWWSPPWQFDTISWFDDLMHFLLWALLTVGVLTVFAPRGLSRGLTTMVALGFGATAAVIWELGEYVAVVRHSSELQTAYNSRRPHLRHPGRDGRVCPHPILAR
jgi:hypothetical protein